MATFVIWTWSRALCARTLMVVARRRGRLVRRTMARGCCGGVERASVSRKQQRERLLPRPGRAFNEASRGCPDALHDASGRGGCLFGGLALSALRCVLSGFERDARRTPSPTSTVPRWVSAYAGQKNAS